MTNNKNPYLNSRSKRILDVSIASAAWPLYAVSEVACAAVDAKQPLVTVKRLDSSGDEFEIKKLNTKLFKRLGKFIVASGIDEIPQVTNILAGTMSIVGPRALLPEHMDEFLGSLPRTLLQTWQDIMPGIKPGVVSTYALAEHGGVSERDRAIMDIFDARQASLKNDLYLLSRIGRTSTKSIAISVESLEQDDAEDFETPETQPENEEPEVA